MAECELMIHLENEEATFHGGDTVRGTVEVRVDEEVQCNGLTVEALWRTRGKGTADRGESIRAELFRGTWQAGMVRRFPFELTLPHGPFTYHGHYLNVVWQIRARADVPWALDPKAEREVALAPRPETAPDWTAFVGGPAHAQLLPAKLRDEVLGDAKPQPAASGRLGTILGFGCLGIIAVPLLGVFVAAGFQVVRFARGEADALEALFMVAVALALASGFGFGAVRLVRNWLAKKRLGQVTLTAEPLLVRRGDEVRIQVVCQPTQEAELVRAVARLEAQEVVTRGSGTDRRTYRHTVHHQETEIALGRSLPARLPFQVDRTVPIPADAAPSFLARNNALRWTLTVEMDLARWPDWAEERALLVHP